MRSFNQGRFIEECIVLRKSEKEEFNYFTNLKSNNIHYQNIGSGL